MKRFRLIYAEEGIDDLQELRQFIAEQTSPRIARNSIRRLKLFCADLAHAPHRGESRVGLHREYRTIGFEGRVSIVFTVSDSDAVVQIVHFHYAGRDWHDPLH